MQVNNHSLHHVKQYPRSDRQSRQTKLDFTSLITQAPPSIKSCLPPPTTSNNTNTNNVHHNPRPHPLHHPPPHHPHPHPPHPPHPHLPHLTPPLPTNQHRLHLRLHRHHRPNSPPPPSRMPIPHPPPHTLSQLRNPGHRRSKEPDILPAPRRANGYYSADACMR